MAQIANDSGGGPPPPKYLPAGRNPRGVVVQDNPEYAKYQQNVTTAAKQAAAVNQPAAKPTAGGGYYVDPNTGDIYFNGQLIGGPDFGKTLPGPTALPGLGGIGGGGITAYEQAQIALDKQKLADAEAQQKADEAYRQSQAIDQFNKNWQDYQIKNYYGSFGGPSSAAPAGSPWFYRLPEPETVQNYYKSNPQAGPDPWSTPIGVSGYSGSGFLNAQQPGTQGTQPMGATPASMPGQQPANPFPGQTLGTPMTPVSNQQTNQPMGQATNQALVQAISSHPDANAYALSLPGVKEAVQAQMSGPQTGVASSTPGVSNASS